MKIYIVEDDADIREMESYALCNSGFKVEAFSTAAELYPALKRERPALLLLDIMLPDEDGMQILRTLRGSTETATLPVMMVTAKTTELDKVRGLDNGADDYITKPFGVMEFVSRVKALLRRTVKTSEESSVYTVGGVLLDDLAHTVRADGKLCELTYKEYELLKFLMLNKELVLSREKIMDKVWGFDYEGESRTVDMHIKTLRRKLGDCGTLIKTVRNVGYKMSL